MLQLGQRTDESVQRSRARPKPTRRAKTPRKPHGTSTAAPGEKAGDDVVLTTYVEAARMLSLSRLTLHKMVVAGELRVRRFGRAVRIPMSEIRRLGTPGNSAIDAK